MTRVTPNIPNIPNTPSSHSQSFLFACRMDDGGVPIPDSEIFRRFNCPIVRLSRHLNLVPINGHHEVAMLSFSRSSIRCKYKTNAGENEGLKRKYGLGNEGPPQGMYCRQRRGEKLDVEYVERSFAKRARMWPNSHT